jgi:hypothetical protein
MSDHIEAATCDHQPLVAIRSLMLLVGASSGPPASEGYSARIAQLRDEFLELHTFALVCTTWFGTCLGREGTYKYSSHLIPHQEVY